MNIIRIWNIFKTNFENIYTIRWFSGLKIVFKLLFLKYFNNMSFSLLLYVITYYILYIILYRHILCTYSRHWKYRKLRHPLVLFVLYIVRCVESICDIIIIIYVKYNNILIFLLLSLCTLYWFTCAMCMHVYTMKDDRNVPTIKHNINYNILYMVPIHIIRYIVIYAWPIDHGGKIA